MVIDQDRLNAFLGKAIGELGAAAYIGRVLPAQRTMNRPRRQGAFLRCV